MSRIASTLLCCSLAFVSACRGDPPQGPVVAVPELKILDNWAGTWDVAVDVKPSQTAPKGAQMKGMVTSRWVLDGRFLDQSGSLSIPDGGTPISVTTLITYDTRKKAYRSWMFFSNGYSNESEGKWDEAAKSLTSIGKDPETGNVTTTVARFPEDGKETWTMIERDSAGKVLGETTGLNTRRRK